MKRHLRYDSAARELRLVLDELWDSQHEHLEYRLPNTRRGGEWDGKDVFYESGEGGGFYVRLALPGDPPWTGQRVRLETDDAPPSVSTKTPCPRLASVSGRAKCLACRDLGYQNAPQRKAANS
jgi:hypothetical protein